MKKADYETLAREIANEIRSADTWLVIPEGEVSDDNKMIARSRRNTSERLANNLARKLHVDRSAFLTACGVKP